MTNDNDERIRDFFDVEFPPTKENWPAFKDEHAKTKSILDEQEVAEDRSRRLELIADLCWRAGRAARSPNMMGGAEQQWKQIRDLVAKMQEQCK